MPESTENLQPLTDSEQILLAGVGARIFGRKREKDQHERPGEKEKKGLGKLQRKK